MPVFGLVITPTDRISARRALEGVDGLTLGEEGARIPAVLELDPDQHDAKAIDALRNLQGIGTVDIAFADFSDVRGPIDASALVRRRRR